MGTLPSLTGAEVVKAFEKLGWTVARQRGSQIIMTKDGEIASLSIPNRRAVARGTLRGLIRTANLTVDQFLSAT